MYFSQWNHSIVKTRNQIFLKMIYVISIITALSPIRKYSGYIYHAV